MTLTPSGSDSTLARAVLVESLTGPSGLRLGSVPVDEVDEDKVLIDVHCAGVSFPDLLMSHGQYQRKPPVPFVPGVEVAGTVRKASPFSSLAVGDRVAAFVRVGGWSEVVAAMPAMLFRLPAEMSFRTAAGIPMNYLTAHLALGRRGRLKNGDTLLVHGASGGLGTALVQCGKAMGAVVIAVVSDCRKVEVAKLAGADEVVLSEGWAESVREIVGPDGVSVVADPVGGDRAINSIRLLAKEGRLIVLGFAGGQIPQIPSNRLLLKNVDVTGVAWGSLIEDEPEFPAEQWSDVMAWWTRGLIRPIDGPSFALEDAHAALECLENRSATGKITLTIRDPSEGVP